MLSDLLKEKRIDRAIDPVAGLVPAGALPSFIKEQDLEAKELASNLIESVEEVVIESKAVIAQVIKGISDNNAGLAAYVDYENILKARYINVADAVEERLAYPLKESTTDIDEAQEQVLDNVSDPRAPLIGVLYSMMQELDIVQYSIRSIFKPGYAALENSGANKEALAVSKTLLYGFQGIAEQFAMNALGIEALPRISILSAVDVFKASWEEKRSDANLTDTANPEASAETGLVEDAKVVYEKQILQGVLLSSKAAKKEVVKKASQAARRDHQYQIIKRVVQDALVFQALSILEHLKVDLIEDLKERILGNLGYPFDDLVLSGLIESAKEVEKKLMMEDKRKCDLTDITKTAAAASQLNTAAGDLVKALGLNLSTPTNTIAAEIQSLKEW